jgi:hypothetical protein
VELGIALGAHPVGVRVQELVRAVGEAHEHTRFVGVRHHAGRERAREAALEVDVAVEVALEQADMPEERHAPVGARVAKDDGELGRRGCRAPFAAIGVAHGERDAGALSDRTEELVRRGFQGSRFYRPMEALGHYVGGVTI